MPQHYIEKILPYSKEQLFALVADIESYPKFLPWCEGARIWEKNGDNILADLIIHFRGITGKYTSRVNLDKINSEITVELAQGPFKHLYQGWKFTETGEGTKVEFDIDFAMRSKIMEKIVDIMFDELCNKMMQAFEKQMEILYKNKK